MDTILGMPYDLFNTILCTNVNAPRLRGADGHGKRTQPRHVLAGKAGKYDKAGEKVNSCGVSL